jgi:hypothetical protein
MVNTNTEEPMNGIYIDKTKKSKAERYEGNRVVLISLRAVAELGMFMAADVVATSVAWVYHWVSFGSRLSSVAPISWCVVFTSNVF